MYTVSLMAAPTRADLGDETIIGLQRRWDGGHAIWLDRGTAAEFPIPDLPADVEAVRADLDARGLDLAVQPTANRRKAVLLADMDSTMIGQECIDELADVAGVGPRVAAITARATRDGGRLTLTATGGPLAGEPLRQAWFFPYDGDVIDHAAAQPGQAGPDGVRLSLTPRSGEAQVLSGVEPSVNASVPPLVTSDGAR